MHAGNDLRDERPVTMVVARSVPVHNACKGSLVGFSVGPSPWETAERESITTYYPVNGCGDLSAIRRSDRGAQHFGVLPLGYDIGVGSRGEVGEGPCPSAGSRVQSPWSSPGPFAHAGGPWTSPLPTCWTRPPAIAASSAGCTPAACAAPAAAPAPPTAGSTAATATR